MPCVDEGYVTAWCEEGNILSVVLLDYFEKELKEEWHREADIVQNLSCGEEPHANLLHYRWHSKGTVLNFDAVCAIACHVISAIERLQDLGILHNNITATNILIA